MNLYTIQLSVKGTFEKQPCVSMLVIDVFARSLSEARTLANDALTGPDGYELDDIERHGEVTS